MQLNVTNWHPWIAAAVKKEGSRAAGKLVARLRRRRRSVSRKSVFTTDGREKNPNSKSRSRPSFNCGLFYLFVCRRRRFVGCLQNFQEKQQKSRRSRPPPTKFFTPFCAIWTDFQLHFGVWVKQISSSKFISGHFRCGRIRSFPIRLIASAQVRQNWITANFQPKTFTKSRHFKNSTCLRAPFLRFSCMICQIELCFPAQLWPALMGFWALLPSHNSLPMAGRACSFTKM